MSADGKGEDPKHAAEHGQISPQDREAIRQRSSELGKKLDAVSAKRAEAERVRLNALLTDQRDPKKSTAKRGFWARFTGGD